VKFSMTMADLTVHSLSYNCLFTFSCTHFYLHITFIILIVYYISLICMNNIKIIYDLLITISQPMGSE
jgi:hypothetical protein